MKRFPWLLTLFCLPLLALLVGLGSWQAQRMVWKEGLIKTAQAAAQHPPVSLSQVLAAQNPEFRRAAVVCPGLATAPFVEMQSILDGQSGSRLISVCSPPGETRPFLVDRGFIPDSVTTRPPVIASTLPLSILVELRRTPRPGMMSPAPSEGRFYARDGAAMARALGSPLPSEFTLFALASTNPELVGLKASSPPAAFSNNHLGYAITWFGLAIVLIGFYVALIGRRLKKEPSN